MEDGDAAYLRNAGETGHRLQLVHHFGVGNEGGAVAEVGNVLGNECTEVAGMLVWTMEQVVLHLLVDGIYTSGCGAKQASAGYDGIEPEFNACLLQEVDDEFATVFILFVHVVERGQVVGWMVCSGHPSTDGVFIHGKLGGGGAGVDYEDSHEWFVSFLLYNIVTKGSIEAIGPIGRAGNHPAMVQARTRL
jgi:hypothetical protein